MYRISRLVSTASPSLSGVLAPTSAVLRKALYRTPATKMPSKDDKYTDPELRNEVKEEIQASDKGGAPGQWSARKVSGCRVLITGGARS